jgi:hypothetical protein
MQQATFFGSTCHHICCIGMIKSIADHISSDSTLKELKKDFNKVVCLIVDERSLLSSKLITRMEYNCCHSVNNGLNHQYSWGNIPIVVLLIGDDYQLPPIESGAFKIFQHTSTPKDTDITIGDNIFQHLASSTTMALSLS